MMAKQEFALARHLPFQVCICFQQQKQDANRSLAG
jgi:hypothetical protein